MMKEEKPMHMTFVRDFDWRPPENPRVRIWARAGKTYDNIRRAMGEAAIAAGAGFKVPAPRRPRQAAK